jgi:hypothetical protein
MGLHLIHISFGGFVCQVTEECTIYWIIVMPLISFAVHEYHDVRKTIVVVDYVSE